MVHILKVPQVTPKVRQAAQEIAGALLETPRGAALSALDLTLLALHYAQLEQQGYVIDLESGDFADVDPDAPINVQVIPHLLRKGA